MCWIIPLIVGSISSFLGYLMGRNTAKISTQKNYEEEKESLLRKIEFCSKQNKELLNENMTMKNSLQSENKPNLSRSLKEGNVIEMSSVTTDKENKKYDELYSKYKQLLEGYKAIKEKGISDADVCSHDAYLSLLNRYNSLEKQIKNQDHQKVLSEPIINEEQLIKKNQENEKTNNFESDLLSAQEEIKTILNSNSNLTNKK